MAKQKHNLNAEYVMGKLEVKPITIDSINALSVRCYSDFISDGKVIIQHSIPYTRHCFDMWDAKTGKHIERNHTVYTAYAAYQKVA